MDSDRAFAVRSDCLRSSLKPLNRQGYHQIRNKETTQGARTVRKIIPLTAISLGRRGDWESDGWVMGGFVRLMVKKFIDGRKGVWIFRIELYSLPKRANEIIGVSHDGRIRRDCSDLGIASTFGVHYA